MNVVSVNGGKVHTMMPGQDEHPYPLCRGGGMNQMLTKYRTVAAELTCKTCTTYAERRAARLAREATQDAETGPIGTQSDAPSATMTEDNNKGDAVTEAPATMNTVKVGFEGKTYHLWDGSSATLLCGRKADGPTIFNHLQPTCKTCIKRSAPMGAANPEETPDMAPKSTALTDEQINQMMSDVHDVMDRLRAVVADDADADKIKTLTTEADAIIRELPAEKRTSLRADVKAAGTVPATNPPATISGTVVEPDDQGYKDVEGVTALMAEAQRKLKSGITHGVKAAAVAEDVSKTILNLRLKFEYEGLPDLMSVGKRPKNAVTDLFREIKNGIPEDDLNARAAFASLQKAQQNKMSDVLVEYIRAMDTPESWEAFASLFPGAAEDVQAARELKEAGAEDITEERTLPSETLYALYESRGITLPRKGRTELMREDRAAKALTAARKELTTIAEKLDAGIADKNAAEEAAKEKAKLEARVAELTEKVPADVVKKIETAHDKTRADRMAERLGKARDTLTTVTDAKAFKKLEKAERDELIGKLEALAGFISTQVAALKSE
jgi:hypothetical protein